MSKLKHRAPGQGKNIKTRTSESVNPDTLHPAFGLTHLRGDYCVTRCKDEEKLALIDRLYKLSQLTWIQIKCSDRHTYGCEVIPRNQIRPLVPAIITDDVDILALRFYKLAPMVGFRDREIFHIVWLDREFKLYDHGKH